MVNWSLINSNERKTSSAKIRKSMVSFMTRHYPCSVIDSMIFDADGRYIKTN